MTENLQNILLIFKWGSSGYVYTLSVKHGKLRAGVESLNKQWHKDQGWVWSQSRELKTK